MDTSLPKWWNLDPSHFTGALNYLYPSLYGGRVGNYVRLRFRLPLGMIEPLPSMIEDPNGGLRIHTAWDTGYATNYNGNHIDVPCILRQANPGGMWDLLGHLDMAIDPTDVGNPFKYHVRLINAWCEFSTFPGVERINLNLVQVRSGSPVDVGIQRSNLPEDPQQHQPHPSHTHNDRHTET